MHRATSRFWESLERLPEPVQNTARRNFEILKSNPAHPSLHFKKVGKYWSARVGRDYRALAVEDGGDFTWVWIGHHDNYDRLVESR
jgi:hypothetical protein